MKRKPTETSKKQTKKDEGIKGKHTNTLKKERKTFKQDMETLKTWK